MFRKPFYKAVSIAFPEYKYTVNKTDEKVVSMNEVLEAESMTAEYMVLQHSKHKHHIIVKAVDNKLHFERVD